VRRLAGLAYAGAAAFTLLLSAGFVALLLAPQFGSRPESLRVVTAVGGVAGLWSLGWLLFRWRRPRVQLLPRQLELAQLAERIDAGLLESQERVCLQLRHYPGHLRRLRDPHWQLGYALQYLDLHLGSGPVVPTTHPLLLALIAVGMAGGLVIALWTGHALIALWYAFTLPYTLARSRIDMVARSRCLADYLRAEQHRLRATAGAAGATGPSLAVLEQQCRFACDINQLELDLQKVLPGYGMTHSLLHRWVAAGVLLLAVAAASVWHSALAAVAGGLLPLAILLGGEWLNRDSRRYRQHLRQWLDDGSLLLRIASEALTPASLAGQLPPVWRSYARQNLGARFTQYAAGLKQSLWTGATFASWLEAGLAPLHNIAILGVCVVLPALLIGILGGTVAVLLIGDAQLLPPQELGALLVLFVALFLGPAGFALAQLQRRRLIGAEEFVRLLQRRQLE
jgi:hypothetical protein